jgi:ATP-binding cassette subfamily B protein
MTRSEGRPADALPPAWSSLWRTVRFGYRVEPRLLSLSLVMTLFTALPNTLVALWLKLLADGVQHGQRTWVWIAALGLGASATLTWFLQLVFQRLDRRLRDRLAISLAARVASLQASIATIEHQERPEHLDRLAMLRDQVFALDHLFMSLFSTLGVSLRMLAALLLLASVHPALLLLALFALPTALVGSWRPGVERVTEEQNALQRRHGRHLFLLGTTASAGKELRVHNLGPFVVERLQASWASWYAAVGRTRWISSLWHAAAWGLFGAAYVGALVWLSESEHATPGALLLVLAAGSQLSQYVGAVIGELGFLRGIWLGSAQRLAWLEDYAQTTLSHAGVTAPQRIVRGIRFDGVSFRYPGTTRLVLDAVSLELPAGATVAVVGENGAGKSTLVKLLCRLYAPTDGRIEVDGVDLATLSVEGWRACLAGAFQDFFRFEFQAHRSVGLGELARMEERRVVQTAVERGGAQDVIQKLDRGLDTQLGPSWSGGAELSFGQWQKLALARGFMRDEPLLLVLDEPTAALDAETEHALFERFAAAAHGTSGNGRITLLVSHRFSTVRMADLIVVLDGSKVVEVGSHDDLMAKRGQYAELYAIQAAALI